MPDKFTVMTSKPGNMSLLKIWWARNPHWHKHSWECDAFFFFFFFQDAACLHPDTIYVLRIKQGQWLSWQCIRCLSVWPSLVEGGCSGRRAQSQSTGWAIEPSTRQWPSRRPAVAAATFRSGTTAPHVSARLTGAMLCKRLKNKSSYI